MGAIILDGGIRWTSVRLCVCAGVVQLCPLGAGVTSRRGCRPGAQLCGVLLVQPSVPSTALCTHAHIMQSCSLRFPFAFSSGI